MSRIPIAILVMACTASVAFLRAILEIAVARANAAERISNPALLSQGLVAGDHSGRFPDLTFRFSTRPLT